MLKVSITFLIFNWILAISNCVFAQENPSAEQVLFKAYEFEQKEKRDSAIAFFSKAGTYFKKNSNWQKYVECLSGENRNFLKVDRIGDVEAKALEAIEIVDDGKANEVDENFVEILTQLSRYNWYAKGNFPESLKYLDRAIEIFDQIDNVLSKRKVLIFTEYGYTYGYSGDFDNSELYFKNALDLALEIFGPESEVVADRYTDMVFPLIQKSEWEKAEVALKRATELNIKLRGSDHISVMKNYNNLGYIYLEKFDNDQAILYINRAIDMIRELFDESHRSIGIGYMNLGASYHNKNEYRNAITYSLKAYENFKVSIGEKNPYMGIVLLNTANAYTYLNILDSAIFYYDKALKLKQELYGEQHHEIVNTYGYMSYFYIANEMYDEANEVINKALEISNIILPKKHKLSANNHLYKSQYFAAIAKYDESLKEAQEALIALVIDFDDSNIRTNPVLRDNIISTRILIDALVHKTTVLKTLAYKNDDSELLDIASETAQVTNQAIDMLRVEYQTPEAKELLIARSKEFYEDAIEIALRLYEQSGSERYLNRAFQYMEKSKSILLIENVRSRSEVAFSGLPDSIASEEKSFSRSISLAKEQMFEARNQGDSSKLEILEKQFFRIKRDHDLLLNFIEENYSDYFSVQHAVFNTSLAAVQKQLNRDEMMVSYFYGKHQLYAIAISKTGLNFIRIELDEEFQSSLTMLAESYEGRTFDPNAAHKIFEQILQPLLGNVDMIKSLVFLPDGILHYIPFEAFVTSNKLENGIEYLVQKYSIYYMHSTSLPESQLKPAKDEDLAYIGFSPSYNIESNPLLASRSSRDLQIASQLEKLPMAAIEIETSASIWSGEYLVNVDATEENFKEKAKYAKIIHIASHTIIDDDEPMNSKLVFSPGADTIEDGLLHTYELYNMQLNAQLACLSACNTGFGLIRSGQGVVSLAKGFFYAGVPNVMMSLWSVPDRSTSEIMTYFYEQLKRGEGKAEALRNAKLRYLKTSDINTSDPYYWAAFTMIGDNEPIEISKEVNLWLLAVILLIGIPVFVIVVIKWT